MKFWWNEESKIMEVLTSDAHIYRGNWFFFTLALDEHKSNLLIWALGCFPISSLITDCETTQLKLSTGDDKITQSISWWVLPVLRAGPAAGSCSCCLHWERRAQQGWMQQWCYKEYKGWWNRSKTWLKPTQLHSKWCNRCSNAARDAERPWVCA